MLPSLSYGQVCVYRVRVPPCRSGVEPATSAQNVDLLLQTRIQPTNVRGMSKGWLPRVGNGLMCVATFEMVFYTLKNGKEGELDWAALERLVCLAWPCCVDGCCSDVLWTL